MPQDYFAPTRNAMAGMTKNLMAAEQIKKQNAMTQARQGAFQDPNRAQGMQALGAGGDIQGMNALAGLGGYEQQQQQMSQEQAMEKIKTFGPLAVKLSAMPEDQLAQAYPGIAQRANQMFPDAGFPPNYSPEAFQGLQSMAQMYQSMQGGPEYAIKEGQYVPTQPGGGPAQPIPGFTPKEGAQYDFKNKGIGILNSVSTKISDGTATAQDITAYKLAEKAFTTPRVVIDPISGQQTIVTDELPAGMPTYKGQKVDKKTPGAPKSIGGMKFKPINDITKVTKVEAQKYRDTAKNVGLMKLELQDMMADINESGIRSLDPQLWMQRSSKYYNTLMLYKEILNLGVLNGPDLDIMEKIMINPASVKGVAGGQKAVENSFNNVIKSLDRNLDYIRGRGIDVGGAATTSAEKVTAPQGALDMLSQNPGMADAFKQKYGYLPEGM